MQREKALTDANQMELTGKEQMIMKKCAFGNVEVAIEEAELERKIKEISAKKSNQQHKEQREMPADEIYMDTCLFSLESCRPQFELIAEELGLGLREQWLVILNLPKLMFWVIINEVDYPLTATELHNRLTKFK